MGKRVRIAILAALAFAALAFAADRFFDILYHPWAYAWLRGSTPLGAWQGEVTAPWGERFSLSFDLRHDIDYDPGAYTTSIQGPAILCPSTQGRIKGRASFWGSRLWLNTDVPFGAHGPLPQEMKCQWQGDSLTCGMDFTNGVKPSIPMTMHRAASASGCAQLPADTGPLTSPAPPSHPSR